MSFLSAALAATLLGAAPNVYRGSEAELAAQKDGRRVLAELSLDIDGDYREDVAVAEEMRDHKLRVLILRVVGEGEDRRFETMTVSSARSASRLARFEVKQILASRPPEVLAVFEEISPDERVQHVRILGKGSTGVAELFGQSFYLPRSDAPETDRVELGDATPRFALVDLDGTAEREGDGDLEVVFYAEPETLALESPGGPVKVSIGVFEDVYRYKDAGGAYVKESARAVEEFTPPKTAWTVEATAQIPKIWGTAQPFWGADGNLETAWSVPGKDSANGEALKVSFKKEESISLIRVVPGCARNAEDWAVNDRVRGFKLELSSGARIVVDRADRGKLDPGLRAVGEFALEGGFGAQTLLLLKDRQPVSWARLTILGVETGSGRRDREACVSEISFH